MADKLSNKTKKLLSTAQEILVNGSGGKIPDSFIHDLFTNVAIEDLHNYSARELSEIAATSWGNFANHAKGTHKIRIYNPKLETEENRNRITIVEVINDNMPFLVKSIMGSVQERGYPVLLVLHPILYTTRNKNEGISSYFGRNHPKKVRDVRCEGIIQIHIEHLENRKFVNELKSELDLVLTDVRNAVTDWPKMRLRLTEAALTYKTNPPPAPKGELNESIQFLEWLGDDNFTFLGMREYKFNSKNNISDFKRQSGSSLGILRNPSVQVLRSGKELVAITPEIRDFLMRPEPLIITKANVRSRVHRRVHLDYIGIKRFDDEGFLTGELRLVGLFGSTTYTESSRTIPYLRRKVDEVIGKSGFSPDSHSGRALMNVLESYPRDELFQVDIETLSEFSEIVLRLGEKPRVRVLPRPDKFNRFVSIMVFVPRDRFNTNVRENIGSFLARIYEGRLSAWYLTYLEGTLVRIHYIVGFEGESLPNPTKLRLEKEISNIIRTWQDNFHDALDRSFPAKKVHLLYKKFRNAFPASYVEFFEAENAIEDIAIIESLNKKNVLEISFYRRADQSKSQLSLKVFQSVKPIPLSERVPLLENMGFRVINERTHRISVDRKSNVYFHDMSLEIASSNVRITTEEDFDRLRELYLAVWGSKAENDGFNSLSALSRLEWRDITILRSISHYLRQIGLFYSKGFMAATLCRYPEISALLINLFHTKFSIESSGKDREINFDRLVKEIDTSLERVESLDDDRILRHFLNAIESLLRTNFYQLNRDGNPKQALAFKFNPKNIDELPSPRPFREMFVYSPRLEGVHMRFGKVARGGLRWSDRPQDFRTEILGLAKAQQVKNAVIVPVGAKGGFVPKNLPENGSREEIVREGTESYKIFISSLLDVTDNLEFDKVIPPKNVIRHDDDDPYLVVAADKGTATFSDIANEISIKHKFWLNDAFASGGSAGYDHKKMGITAKGAWEAVKRHFRESDRNIQKQPFTVVGVGDMSGDVFGNGMLLSEATKLIAAFDHRDIFIDPNPNPKSSWKERDRLFKMNRSSWQDYDQKTMSKGGAVFKRNAKSVELSREIQSLLGIESSKSTPQEVLQAILKLEVDLLWFGGIGTFVCSSTESKTGVGDRANDSIRITATELRCKVVGEGANLGLTQLARIEFNRIGGACNSDAIDNSAGVNSSDLEVNIKIALGTAVRAKKLTTKGRNALLSKMTDNVEKLVLMNNYRQTLAISVEKLRGMEGFNQLVRLMRNLENRDLLNREVELLPDDLAIVEMEAANQPFTRAEISVVMSYAKLTVYEDLLATDVPDEQYFEKLLLEYFPDKMQSEYKDEILQHRLRREIITTQLVNQMINFGGPTFASSLCDQTGKALEDCVKAFIVAMDAFDMKTLVESIDKKDNDLKSKHQLDLYQLVQETIIELAVWFMQNIQFSNDDLAKTIERFQTGVRESSKILPKITSNHVKERMAAQIEELCCLGLSKDISKLFVGIPMLVQVPNLILVSEIAGKSLEKVASTFFEISEYFKIDQLETLARNMSIVDYYDGFALGRAKSQLAAAHRQISINVLTQQPSSKGFKDWLQTNNLKADRTRGTVNEIVDAGSISVSKLTMATSLLADLADKNSHR